MNVKEIGLYFNLTEEAQAEIQAAFNNGARFFVIASASTRVYERKPKYRLIAYNKGYFSALKTFEGWRSDKPTLFYWGGDNDLPISLGGPDWNRRLEYLGAQHDLMTRGLIPSNHEQREALLTEIRRYTPCQECGQVGLGHTAACSLRQLTRPERIEKALGNVRERVERYLRDIEQNKWGTTEEAFGQALDAFHDLRREANKALEQGT